MVFVIATMQVVEDDLNDISIEGAYNTYNEILLWILWYLMHTYSSSVPYTTFHDLHKHWVRYVTK